MQTRTETLMTTTDNILTRTETIALTISIAGKEKQSDEICLEEDITVNGTSMMTMPAGDLQSGKRNENC
ncbi:unnamed protein product [Caenorhabditis nigoni]